MGYKNGTERGQVTLLPDCLENYVNEDNPVRVIDAFCEGLNIERLGFNRFTPAETGRPAYAPGDLLRLYVYGYMNGIRNAYMIWNTKGGK